MGANASSSIFYNRVKGEMEAGLQTTGYRSLVIARPSMLAGNREALEQPARSGERIALFTTRWLKAFIPWNYQSIQARDVAYALVNTVVQASPGVFLLLSGEMQGASVRS